MAKKVVKKGKKIGVFERALSFGGNAPLYSQIVNGLFDAGMEFKEMTNYPQAILHFTQCIEKSPYYYDAYLNRGICELRQGDEEKAMKDYDMAIVKNPDSSSSSWNTATNSSSS